MDPSLNPLRNLGQLPTSTEPIISEHTALSMLVYLTLLRFIKSRRKIPQVEVTET